ncbi:hypothetical protein MML48_4g00006075 [Holotrichia oblita]|uniref:Uncharacterized protein n=1 Tax=Holotrichia oblita TaxID=644536 RepID=A0ACB9T806_HOLOL|nr:hypothetical protein MML48_4g00006075 [Holotrichia oblita]
MPHLYVSLEPMISKLMLIFCNVILITYQCNFSAWVDDENIKPYLEFKPILATSSKNSSFRKAVAEIDEYIKKRNSDPNFKLETENEIDSEFNRLKEEENEKPVTPKKRKMSGTKRNSESSKVSSAKKRKSTPTENGASSSYSSSVVTRNYEEILNRPSILDVPIKIEKEKLFRIESYM